LDNLPMPGMVAALGLDQVISVVDLKARKHYTLYPKVKAYHEEAFLQNVVVTNEVKLARESLGREIVDGHLCEKEKVTLPSNDKAGEGAMILWHPRDFKGFPVRIEIRADGLLRIRFRDVKLVKLDQKFFEVPADYKKFDGIASIVQSQSLQKGSP